MFLDLYRLCVRGRGKIFTILCRSNFCQIGRHTVIMPPIRLRGEGLIKVGRQVFIGPNSWLEVMKLPSKHESPVVTIGDETSIVGSCTITAVQRVVIEPRVLMARNVYISDHTHMHGSREIPIKDQGVSNVAPVRICEGAWIGQNVVICPGVTVGRNAVVGANSVVREDVPDYCVAAGSPAKVIRNIDHT
jgi:carbonic anhydrase/acetyltransferase-like protein (isoleucine patch superfamily)